MFKILVLVLAISGTVLAAHSSPEDCFSGALADYLPLSGFAPAQDFCAQHYPNAFTTRTVCSSTTTSVEKREDGPIEARDGHQSHGWDFFQGYAFDELTQQSQITIAKVCYCIAFTSTSSTETIKCDSSEYCDSQTGTCQSRRNCNNPARCDASSVCLNQNSLACFCHPDTDDAESGYCMGDGPAGAPCPEAYEDCASNSDCSGTGVCIYACCREQPFCVKLDDYGCANYKAPSRLFRRGVMSKRVVGMNPTNGRNGRY